MNFRLYWLLALSLVTEALCAQNVRRDTLSAWMIAPTVSLYTASGELGDRIERGSSLGLDVSYKTNRNWQWGVEGHYLYSNQVRNRSAVISPVLSQNNRIFNPTGNYANIAIDLRGAMGLINVSKTTGIWAINPNSGLFFGAAAGYLSYWYNISSDDPNIPQLQDEYDKGYDRWSAGFMLRQSVGYQFLSAKRTVNFRLSFELSESWTEDLRGYSYASGQQVSGSQSSLLYGLRLQWVLPIYQSATADYYYD